MRWPVTALNFVLCPRFHGATALGLLLNNHSKVSSLGDMFPSSEFDQSCGCGKNVSQCPFWQLLERKFAAMLNRGPGVLYPAWPRVLGRRSVNDALVNTTTLLALHTTPRVWRLLGGGPERFIGFYLDFVRTVNEYNDTSVFVNGQKSLKAVLALKSILGDRARVNIVHLVRDPRGFHCSEKKADPDIGVDDSARRWHSYHRRVTRLVRPLANAGYLAVRYEDLCKQPEPTMTKVFDFLGVEYQDVSRPPSLHHLVGHKSKGQFDGTLSQNLTWQKALSEREQEQCLALTRPLSEELGYRLAGGR